MSAHSEIHVAHAFDMRDPAQRAALGAALAKTPVEQAQDRLFAAGKRVDWFVAQHLTISQAMAFCHAYEVPVGLDASKASRLADLVSTQRQALADLAALKASIAAEDLEVELSDMKWAAE